METFGHTLRRIRLKNGKTMGDVARQLGISVPYLSDVERDRRAPFSPDKIAQIAAFLDVSADELTVAAVRSRGSLDVDPSRLGETGIEAIALLARSELSETQWAEILNLARRKVDGGE